MYQAFDLHPSPAVDKDNYNIAIYYCILIALSLYFFFSLSQISFLLHWVSNHIIYTEAPLSLVITGSQ